jgi:hypothetical protein
MAITIGAILLCVAIIFLRKPKEEEKKNND